jgi:anthranilate synthase component 1
LINDPKERAEHVMLIDLARNDIGRIAKIGSVKVTEAFSVERYSHVMHIVSNVEGTLLEGMTSMDVLKATFPAGTLTGAPKVHAMELIDQLEPTKRGLYGGACGYLSYAGDMDVAIAIRTWWLIRCLSWNGKKPRPRRARCCGRVSWWKKGWSKSWCKK